MIMKLVVKVQQLIMDSRGNFLSYPYLHWYKYKFLFCKLKKSVQQKEVPPPQ